jgi:uncharacterized membrane protein
MKRGKIERYIDNDDYALDHEKTINTKYSWIYRYVFLISLIGFCVITILIFQKIMGDKSKTAPTKVYIILYIIFIVFYYYWYYYLSIKFTELLIANSYKI